MNKKIIFVTILVFVLIIISLLMKGNNNPKELISNPEVSVNEVALCYSYVKTKTDGIADRAWLKSTIKGELIKGEYHNLPAESDSKTGTFEGYLYVDANSSDALADVWWYSFAEGMYVTEQLHIGFDNNGAAALFGEMVDRGDGVYMYKDTDNVTKGFQMTQIDCDKLDAENVSLESEIETGNIPVVPKDGVIACTMDAMMCPDGSYVGRVAPNCEFQACPSVIGN